MTEGIRDKFVAGASSGLGEATAQLLRPPLQVDINDSAQPPSRQES